jgi:tetratricopeptide (TPR) repeat protein
VEERVPGADDRESAYELFQRGQELIRGRHHAQAAIVLERASRLEPNKGSILEALGRACFNSAQYQQALETFERLLEVDPSSPYAHFGLGQSLKRLGRPVEARPHLKLAVALDPRSSLYRGALARLGTGPAPRKRAPAGHDDDPARDQDRPRDEEPAPDEGPARGRDASQDQQRARGEEPVRDVEPAPDEEPTRGDEPARGDDA